MSREVDGSSVPRTKKARGERKLTDSLTETLINEVQSRPSLWNKFYIDYKNSAVSREQWDEVGAVVDLPGDEARKKWKNLKDTYRRILQKPGSTADSEMKWKFSELMEFTREQMVSAPLVEGLTGFTLSTNEFIEVGFPSDNDNDMQPVLEHSEVEPESIISTPEVILSTSNIVDKSSSRSRRSKASPKAKRNKKKKFAELEEKKTETILSEKKSNVNLEEGDDYHFLMSLIPFIKPLEPLDKLHLRTKIQYDVMEAYRKYEHQKNSVDFRSRSSCSGSTQPETSTGSSTPLQPYSPKKYDGDILIM